MSIKDRFNSIINECFNGNQSAFAKAVGVNPTVIANVVGPREGNPSFDVLVKICANANISPEWLLLGKGDMRPLPASLDKIQLTSYKVIVSNLERKVKVQKAHIDELERANEELTRQLLENQKIS